MRIRRDFIFNTSGPMRSHLPSGKAETLVTPSSTLAHTVDQSLTMMCWSWPCLTRRRRHVLFPCLDRHIEFGNVVPFPLAPEGLAQAGRHGLALLLQHNDHPGKPVSAGRREDR